MPCVTPIGSLIGVTLNNCYFLQIFISCMTPTWALISVTFWGAKKVYQFPTVLDHTSTLWSVTCTTVLVWRVSLCLWHLFKSLQVTHQVTERIFQTQSWYDTYEFSSRCHIECDLSLAIGNVWCDTYTGSYRCHIQCELFLAIQKGMYDTYWVPHRCHMEFGVSVANPHALCDTYWTVHRCHIECERFCKFQCPVWHL